uniref:Uncharacterized protein n=1 Tax=Cyprinus carpio TaxID=7962 RepID=A0A8C2H4N1_CYPCA
LIRIPCNHVLLSVSESLSTFITLNICTDITEISSDLSDANVLKIPLNHFFVLLNYRERFGLLKGLLVLPCPPFKNCIHPE